MIPERAVDPFAWQVIVVTAGRASHGWLIPLDVLHRAAPAFDGAFVWVDRRALDHHVHRVAANLAGTLSDPRPSPEGVAAVLRIFPHRTDIADWLLAAYDRWREDYRAGTGRAFDYPVGLSILLDADRYTLTPRLAGAETLTRLSRVVSVDLVEHPATQARILGPCRKDETMPKTETPDLVAVARDEAARLLDAERALDEKLVALDAALAGTHAGAGDAVLASVLDNHDPGPAIERARTADVERSALIEGIAAARSRRREAIERYWRAQATRRRTEADALDAEADQVAARTGELLAELEAHEGTPYIPRRRFEQALSAQGVAVWGAHPAPRSDRLRERAKQLRSEAEAYEARRIADQSGTLEGTGVDALLARLSADPLVIEPAAWQIRAWVAEQGKPVGTSAVYQRSRDRDEKYRYVIRWRDGAIRKDSAAYRIAAAA